MTRRGAVALGTVGWLILAATPTAAQLAPIGVPRGALRIELGGRFDNADSRWFQGRTEAYAQDYGSTALGSAFFPELSSAEARIAALSGVTGFRYILGATTADADARLGTLTVGLALGLTRRLTVFGRVPFVRQRIENNVQFTSGNANAGFNPADPRFGTFDGPSEAAAFFGQMNGALASLALRITAGDYDGDPALRALADATLASGITLRDGLTDLIQDPATAATFLPTTSSAAGTALVGLVTGLQGTLSGPLGIVGFTALPTLPTTPLTPAEFTGFLTNPGGPIAARRLSESRLFLAGDAEVGLSYTLVDGWDRPGQPLGGVRAAATVLVRLPTGTLPRSDDLLGVGTGDRQADIAGRLTVDIGRGSLGARLTGGYTRQLPGPVERRVAPPSQPLPYANRTALLQRDPGDILELGIRPFLRLAPALALQFGVTHWRRQADQWTYQDPATAPAGIDAGVLGLESEANGTLFGGGLSYANRGNGLPVEASWTYEGVVHATGGRVTKTKTVRMDLRLYFSLWR